MSYLKTKAIESLRPGAKFSQKGTVVTWVDTEQTEPTDQEIQDEMDRQAAEVPWNELRTKRNQLLAETDYLALSDVTLSTEMAEYRQALRDLPANTTDPANPVFPNKPGA